MGRHRWSREGGRQMMFSLLLPFCTRARPLSPAVRRRTPMEQPMQNSFSFLLTDTLCRSGQDCMRCVVFASFCANLKHCMVPYNELVVFVYIYFTRGCALMPCEPKLGLHPICRGLNFPGWRFRRAFTLFHPCILQCSCCMQTKCVGKSMLDRRVCNQL